MTHSNTYILSCIYQLSFLFSTVHTSQVPHRLLPHKAQFRFLLMALKKSAVVKSVQRRSRLISVGCGLSGLSCSSFVSAQKTDRKRLKMYLVTGKQLLQFFCLVFSSDYAPLHHTSSRFDCSTFSGVKIGTLLSSLRLQ